MVLRLSDSKEKQPRWERKYIEEQMLPLAGCISKIAVCGSPAMNETFDRTFEALGAKILVKPEDIEIM